MLGLLKELVAATLGAVTANSEQDVHVAPDQIIHGGRHIDRTARGAKDRPAVLVNVINEGRRQHCRFLAARRIKTLITASKPQHFRNSVGMMEFKKKRADHVVQAGAQAAAGHDAGACLRRVEKQFVSRPGQLKQHLFPRGYRRIAHDLGRDSCLVADRMSQR